MLKLIDEYDKALEINPNNPDLLVTKGDQLATHGRYEEGIELIHQGMKSNQHHPEWYFWSLGIVKN
jgi:adenylate cyclase